MQRIQDHDGDQLFGKMIGPVVVGTIGDQHRKPVGFPPSAHQMVAGGFAGRIGAARVIRRGFGEFSGGAQGTKDLVRRDMVKAKAIRLAPPDPMRARGFQ